MNKELETKLQAYLDGELSGREAGRVAVWLEDDAKAQALAAELRGVREIMAEAGELERGLPENVEFFWSKIEREINRGDRREAARGSGWAVMWRRLFAPAVAVVTVLLLGTVLLRNDSTEPGIPYLAHNAEEETGSGEMGFYSYRSSSGNMIVWLFERTPDTPSDPMDVLVIP